MAASARLKWSRNAAVVLVNVAILILLVVVLEVGARLLFPRNLESLFNDPGVFIRGRPFVVASETRGFALRPGFEREGCRVNSAGFRGPELAARTAGTRLILTLGESTTFGWQVDDSETYPACLERALAERSIPGPITVVNGGVPSYTSPQVLLYMKELLPELEPDLVLVNVFWNDLLYSCLKNWLPDYLIIQQPARWRQLLLRYSGVYRALVVRGEGAMVEEDRVNARALSYYRQNLSEMVEECERHGTRLVFVEPPFDPHRLPGNGLQIRKNQFIARDLLLELAEVYVRTMKEVGAEHQVTTIGHRLAAAGEEAAEGDHFLDLVHPSPAGYRVMAAEIADRLIEEALVTAPRSAGH